jgi:hypothetical protein
MNAIELISQDLFDKVRSRFSNLQMGDESGAVTVDPTEARFFDFDFVVEGNNLGRISVSINDLGNLKLFYSQGIVEERDPVTQQFWFDFLKEMRQFAMRRLLRFDPRDITKGNLEKNDFQYLAQNGSKEDNMTESTMYGSSKSSYRPLDKTLLIIRHNNKVGEDRGARSRSNNINAIFIQNEAGERFKYPMVHMAGAKAMQRHVSNGGATYDDAGQSIIKMSEQIRALSTFKRQIGNSEQLTQEALGIVDRASGKLSELRSTIENLSKQTYYAEWRESLANLDLAEQTELDPTTFEDYKSKFTVSSFKEDLTQYFPLLYSIMQEAGDLDLADYVGEDKEETCGDCGEPVDDCECDDHDHPKEGLEAFEDWANEIVEGPNKSDIPASQRKAKGGDWKVSTKDLEDEKDKSPTGSAGLAKRKKELGMNEGAYQDLGPNGREIYTKVQALRDKIRNGEVKPDEKLQQDFDNLLVGHGMDPEFAETEWMRITGQSSKPTIDPSLRKQAPPMTAPKDSDDEDDDASFLQKLRMQAKGGSIKPGVDVGGVDEENDMPSGQHSILPIKEIAEKVLTHIDRETGGCPLGATAVGIQIAKEHGPAAGALAEKLVHHLQAKIEARKQMESMRRLAGLPKLAEDHAPWYKDQADADADKKKSEFKKKNNPNRTGKDTAKALSQKGLKKASNPSESTEKKTMSRAAKGNEKYGKDGMKELAKAGRNGASEKKMDTIRKKHDNYKD